MVNGIIKFEIEMKLYVTIADTLNFFFHFYPGILTGSIYNDKVLKIMGFPGENIQNSSVLVVKTHDYGRNETQKYQRAILILRNPKDALLAEFNRLRGGHIGFARKEDFTKSRCF